MVSVNTIQVISFSFLVLTQYLYLKVFVSAYLMITSSMFSLEEADEFEH